jgi:hypothetical protein
VSENQVPKTKSQRELLTEDILDQVSRAIHEELQSASPSPTETNRTEIVAEILVHSNLVMNAASTAELTSEGALLSHIRQSRSDAQRLIRERIGKRIAPCVP